MAVPGNERPVRQSRPLVEAEALRRLELGRSATAVTRVITNEYARLGLPGLDAPLLTVRRVTGDVAADNYAIMWTLSGYHRNTAFLGWMPRRDRVGTSIEAPATLDERRKLAEGAERHAEGLVAAHVLTMVGGRAADDFQGLGEKQEVPVFSQVDRSALYWQMGITAVGRPVHR